MPTLILLRHGQSQWNLEDRFTGWVDVDLTAKGEAEARKGGELIKAAGIAIDRVFTSVLTRAIRTSWLALQTAGQAGLFTGRFAEARIHFEEALWIARELGDSGRAASILQTLGMTFGSLGDRPAAQRCLHEALDLAQSRGDQREHAAALNALAQWHRLDGAPATAEPLYAKALLLTRELGDHENTAVALLNLALLALGRAAPDAATPLLLEALTISESIGSRLATANGLAVTAGAAASLRNWKKAAWFAGAASSQMSKTGLQLDTADASILEPLTEQTRQALPAPDYAAVEAEGQAATESAALAAAQRWLISR